ncbi:MAG: lactate racemase domain-containing protein [Planctomycetaceae bacterium]|nr:lactate racemase domain-containing protein [Planctomycetaceae bacterium]
MAILRYGVDSQIELTEVDAASLGQPHGASQPADPAAATTAALESPLDYPPLARCVTPADRVVLALDHGAPGVDHVIAATVRCLIEAGVEPEAVTLLQSRPNDDPRGQLESSLRQRVALHTHDPDDRRQLAYLAASESGEPILINRHLHEADVVLPIVCLRADETAGYYGIHGAVFPAFSDAKTLQRFRSPGALHGDRQRRSRLIAEADEAAWLLGVHFTIQLLPAGGDALLHVLAGQSDSVRRHGQELYATAWRCEAAGRADLVVAAVEGDARQQTWENLARALQAADALADEDGAIALCSELIEPPGPALQHLACKCSHGASHHTHKERSADSLPAALLADVQKRHKIYLLSRLDAAVVEDLDLVPLADADELSRLVEQRRSCILLSNAPYVSVVHV